MGITPVTVSERLQCSASDRACRATSDRGPATSRCIAQVCQSRRGCDDQRVGTVDDRPQVCRPGGLGRNTGTVGGEFSAIPISAGACRDRQCVRLAAMDGSIRDVPRSDIDSTTTAVGCSGPAKCCCGRSFGHLRRSGATALSPGSRSRAQANAACIAEPGFVFRNRGWPDPPAGRQARRALLIWPVEGRRDRTSARLQDPCELHRQRRRGDGAGHPGAHRPLPIRSANVRRDAEGRSCIWANSSRRGRRGGALTWPRC